MTGRGHPLSRGFSHGWAGVLPGPGRARRARERAHDKKAVDDAVHLLGDGLCPVCRERDDFAARWLSYFVIETHTEAGTRARVEASAGFCPTHSRRLLADISSSWLMPQVHDLALTGGTRLLGEPGARRARCPCCVAGDDAAQRALKTLLYALGHPVVRDGVQTGEVCLPHTAVLATCTSPEYALRLAGAACALLEAGQCDTGWLAGEDKEAETRAALLARVDPLLVEEERQREGPVTGRWEADVEADCCPLCLAEHRAVRRLLIWTAATTDRGRPAGEESVLCARHLHDLTSIGGPNVAAVVTENCDRWSSRLSRFRRLLGEGAKRRADAGPYLLSGPHCRACQEEHTAVDREAALLTAMLRDPVHVHTFTQSHGICLRHAVDWQGARPGLVDEVLTGRLALLRWEIDEALRKQDWHTRHETRGAENSVGRRAPTLLDGRVYGGLPAPPRHSPAHGDPPEDGAPSIRRRT